MIMRAREDGDDDEFNPGGEGKTETLGLNLPPSLAAAIRRKGFRESSISKTIFSLIDPSKLRALLEEDARRRKQFESENQQRPDK